ncbi:Hypothetical_protein [Hexamita inflata]|uniref:Hypothetical_protein n=1 Tax=Hexamita inflata TaxID=28002 RepID=A0AA86TW38_9EUKA|nr:Hypothetical protein HINF_LOCUS16967 [Hexamita inflata]
MLHFNATLNSGRAQYYITWTQHQYSHTQQLDVPALILLRCDIELTLREQYCTYYIFKCIHNYESRSYSTATFCHQINSIQYFKMLYKYHTPNLKYKCGYLSKVRNGLQNAMVIKFLESKFESVSQNGITQEQVRFDALKLFRNQNYNEPVMFVKKLSISNTTIELEPVDYYCDLVSFYIHHLQNYIFNYGYAKVMINKRQQQYCFRQTLYSSQIKNAISEEIDLDEFAPETEAQRLQSQQNRKILIQKAKKFQKMIAPDSLYYDAGDRRKVQFNQQISGISYEFDKEERRFYVEDDPGYNGEDIE